MIRPLQVEKKNNLTPVKSPSKRWIFLCLLITGVMLAEATGVFAFQLQASWYSESSLKKEGTWRYSHGKMANGRMYDETKFTCATRLFPLGTKLRIKSLETKKVCEVIVTDRIGKRFAKTRIDLSKVAFMALAPLKQGLIQVEVERIP